MKAIYLQTPCTLFTPLQSWQNTASAFLFQSTPVQFTYLLLYKKGSKVLEINNLELHNLECNQRLQIYKDGTQQKKNNQLTNLDYDLLVKAETKHN